MVGKTILKLGKDTFNYSERDSLFIGSGLWSLSKDKKTIYLRGSTTLKDYKDEEFALRKSLDLELEIKDKTRLTYNGQIYIKHE